MRNAHNLFEVPFSPGYFVSNDTPAVVYRRVYEGVNSHMEPYEPLERDVVPGDDSYDFPGNGVVRLSELMMRTFYGDVHFPIYVQDQNKGLKSFSYLIPRCEQFDADTLAFQTTIEEEKVHFRRIPNYSDYYISDTGVVYSRRQSTIMKWSLNKDHHWVVCPTRNDGTKVPARIDRLVYAAWINPNITSADFIVHRDGLWYNVNWANLDITSREKLHEERVRAKALNPDPPKRAYTRIDSQAVHTICQMLVDRKSNAEIAEALSIDYKTKAPKVNTTVYNILHGKSFVDISRQYDFGDLGKTTERRYAPKKPKEEVNSDEYDSGQDG